MPPHEADEFFARQRTGSAQLGDPRPLVENLARSIIEVLAGAREIEQIARWMTEDVYAHLLNARRARFPARIARKQPVLRPDFALGGVRVTHPDDGVVEAVVIVHGRARSRAIALRLERLDSRWRATAIHVL